MENDYKNMYFPSSGPLNTVGLTTAGVTLTFGEDEIWDQDQSIMGWTCGYAISSCRDVAKFYFDLLGPEPKILSAEAVATMQEFNKTDLGWSANFLMYGAGLMTMNSSPTRYIIHEPIPSLKYPGTYIGHGGETYGFSSL